MKGAPSIAVMLGGVKKDDESEGDLSLSEAKKSAEDAATAFADAVEAKDAKRIVKSFHALYDLCEHVRELEESGETDEEEKKEEDEGESDDEEA